MIDAGESRGTVQSLMMSKRYTFQVLLDQDGSVNQRYHVLGHPVKFLLDKKGNLVFSAMGFREWDAPEMIELFEQMVREAWPDQETGSSITKVVPLSFSVSKKSEP